MSVRMVEILTMSKITLGSQKLKPNSFTLVELLVVISIIGLLAGLAVPAIQGGLDKAKQQVDVSNARQLGVMLFTEANDNNGFYRCNQDLTNTTIGSTMAVINGLIDDRVLTTTKILAGNGVIPAQNTNNVTSANVAWALGLGLNTSDEADLPLVITKGTSAAFGSQDIVPNKTKCPWKDKGVAIYYVGNNAVFKKSSSGGKILAAMTTTKPQNASARISDP